MESKNEKNEDSIWLLEDEKEWRLVNGSETKSFERSLAKMKNEIDRKLQKVKEEGKPENEEKDSGDLFSYSLRKTELTGQVVYTPFGYAIIQKVLNEEDKIITKSGSQGIQECQRRDVLYDIPLSLLIFTKNTVLQDQVIVPVNSRASEVLAKISGHVLKNAPEINSLSSVFFKGKKLEATTESLELLGVVPYSKFIVTWSSSKLHSINRFGSVEGGWGYSEGIDSIMFSCTADIFVGGIGIYGPESGSSELAGEACLYFGKLIEGKKEQSKTFQVSENNTDGQSHIAKIMFDKPLRLKAGESMTISLRIHESNSYYGSCGLSTVFSDESGITFSFSECSSSDNGTSIDSGQIPEIYFYH